MRISQAYLGACSWLCVIIIMAGCGGSGKTVPEVDVEGHTSPALTIEQDATYPVPALSTIRATSADGPDGEFRYGSDYLDSTYNQLVTVNDTVAVFTPAYTGADAASLTDAAYCIYRLNLSGPQPNSWLTFRWGLSPAELENVWVGLSNFESGRWEWRQLTQLHGLEVYNFVDYRDEDGNLYVAVLLLQNQAAMLDWINFGWIIDPALPVADVRLNIYTGTTPVRIKMLAGGSYTDEGEIVSYEFDFEGYGIWDHVTYSPMTQWSQWVYVAGEHTPTVRVTNDGGFYAYATESLSISGNAAPIAMLAVDPASGETPLLVEFDATGSTDPDGGTLSYAFDFDGDGTWDREDTSHKVSHTYIISGVFHPALRVTDEIGASVIISTSIEVTGNEPPVASLSATPGTGAVDLLVQFDASGSFDPEVEPLHFEWDLEGDGNVDLEGSELDTAEFLFEFGGSYTARVTVTDALGATSTAFATVEVTGPYWHPVVVYGRGSAPFGIHLIDAASQPLLLASDRQPRYTPTGSLNVHSGADYQGSSWQGPFIPNYSPAGYTMFFQIGTLITGGLPAFVGSMEFGTDFNDRENELAFVLATDAAGTSWAEPVRISPGTKVRNAVASAAVIDGLPAALGRAYSNGLFYSLAQDANGTAWEAYTFVGLTTNEAHLTNHGELPVVYGLVAGEIMQTRGADPQGSSWSEPELLIADVDAWDLSTLEGLPALIVCQDGVVSILKATDSSATAWHAPLSTGFSTELTVSDVHMVDTDNGPIVAVAVTDYTVGMGYLAAKDRQGTSWSATYWESPDWWAAALSIDWNQTFAMASIDGHPAVAVSRVSHYYAAFY